MATMADAVDWQEIPTDAAAAAGYIDGADYPWPSTAWGHFYGRPVLRVSVLADDTAEAFDVETGNATAGQVAEAISVRTARGLPSVVYTNGNGLPGVVGALASKSLRLLPAAAWPSPGPYLWAASPRQAAGTFPAWAPVTPVAVQNRYLGTYDLSTLTGSWLPPVLEAPAKPGGTAPADPTPAPRSPSYVPAPDSTVRFPRSVSYVPTPTLDDALAALAHGTKVYVWTVGGDEPVEVTSADELKALEHTGDHAYPQYVTYTAVPID